MHLNLNMNLFKKNVPLVNDIDEVQRKYAPVLYFTKDKKLNERKLEQYQDLYDVFQIKNSRMKSRANKQRDFMSVVNSISSSRN